jgi:type II secretion system protein J
LNFVKIDLNIVESLQHRSATALWRRAAMRAAGRSVLPAGRTAARSGFTLIEMILAIGIAAIVLITVNAAFFAALHLRDDTANMLDEATPVDAAVTFIKRDLQCAVTPTNGTSKVLSGGFRVGNNINSFGESDPVAVELFTATGALSENAPWADIQRVTYELKTPTDSTAVGRDLYRSVVRNLLPISTPDVTDQLMLNGVQSLKFSCYDGAQWMEMWDTTDPTSIYTNLPLAVKVEIQMAGRADTGPIEIVVPMDSVARTNAVLTASTSTGG